MTDSLIPFDFHGDRLMLVDEDGQPRIVLRPAMDALGLDYSTQYTKLKSRSWARVGQSPTTGADGKTYQMVTVDVRTFLMLLATIDERRVAKDVAPKLITYQAEVADAIESYWTQLGETPMLDARTKPLTVSIYLSPKGLTAAATKKVAGQFGKRLKKAYIGEFGEAPSEIEDMVGRHVVQVAQYQERHRPLFDRVWSDLAAVTS